MIENKKYGCCSGETVTVENRMSTVNMYITAKGKTQYRV